ncbi:MAG TPA: cysteine--tRNA ligase [Clostridia bacterium]|nr:cysteine--tRNA ligase [Clostridia bacterium]
MKIYNSFTRQKDEFVPINDTVVNMYVCGPTVYNFFHIGNARPFLIFDAFRSYLEYKGYEVNYVQNFTDIDDKIIDKANEEGVTAEEISERYIKEYFKDADALGIKRATQHPKVSEYIPQIIAFVETLIDKGYAYDVGGNVYYSVEAFEDYGNLSKQDMESLRSGSRVQINVDKRNPLDFILWKNKKPGEPSWKSPWGEGRPGWHIECSVMSTSILGANFDIHAGGQDLIFPHHENEIAQSVAGTGEEYANYWMHNGYINIDNKKMSKSKGNFFTVRDILEKYDAEVIRFFILSAHYRSPVNFSEDLIISAKNGLDRLYNVKNNLTFLLENASEGPLDLENKNELDGYKKEFIEKMDDDFNTANGIAAIFELAKAINIIIDNSTNRSTVAYALELFNELTGVLRIVSEEEDSDEAIDALIAKRQKAREEKDYQLADEIRDELDAKGIEVMDTPDGVKWRKVK